MKIHTSNREKVESILKSTKINGKFWDYTLSYREYDSEEYSKFHPLDNPHYTDLPEFKWSDWLRERVVFDVNLNTEEDREAFFEAFDHNPTINNYIHYELDEHPLKEYEYEYTHKIEPKYPIYVITSAGTTGSKIFSTKPLASIKTEIRFGFSDVGSAAPYAIDIFLSVSASRSYGKSNLSLNAF
jgi:hypothetical protein